MTAWARAKLEKAEKEEDGLPTIPETPIINVGVPSRDSTSSGIFDSGIREDYSSPVVPRTAFHIRNRMLSKMGAKVSGEGREGREGEEG